MTLHRLAFPKLQILLGLRNRLPAFVLGAFGIFAVRIAARGLAGTVAC
jgi:hypothetical protein